jgi:HEAT repeat protein
MRLVFALIICLVAIGCSAKQPLTVHGKPVSHWAEVLRTEKDPKARKKAAAALGNAGAVDPAVVPALIEAVRDRDARVRAEAVSALLKIGPEASEAAAVLTEALRDPDTRVRALAAKVLARVKRASGGS